MLPSGFGLSQTAALSRDCKASGHCRFDLGLPSCYLLSTPLEGRNELCWTLFNAKSKICSPSAHLFRTRVESHGTTLETDKNEEEEPKRDSGYSGAFWTAVGLIMGTAIGPGILGLPAATIKAGPLPSSLTILASWVYVIASILLVAEIGCAVMEEQGLDEVSFTGLAMHTLGDNMGIVVAVIYAMLNYTLLVACIAGLGSLVLQWLPFLPPFMACLLFPGMVGGIIVLASFNVIDGVNKGLCVLMATSISGLIAVGVLLRRHFIWESFKHAAWFPSVLLPAIPVTVLTLGFHVITPFICKVMGRDPYEVRKAILCGGAVPLAMVLSWNVVVLGLARSSPASRVLDPIKLLLSVNSSAVPAVQAFAFSALGTTLIGYAVSFPKQLFDTLHLIRSLVQHHSEEFVKNFPYKSEVDKMSKNCNGAGRGSHVIEKKDGNECCEKAFLDNSLDNHKSGTIDFLGKQEMGLHNAPSHGHEMMISANNDSNYAQNDQHLQKFNKVMAGKDKRNFCVKSSITSQKHNMPQVSSPNNFQMGEMLMICLVLGPPILIGTFFPTAFAAALDFAGVYANCFLFGILPPVMAWIHRYGYTNRGMGVNKKSIQLVPGGKGSLIVLLAIAMVLGVRLPI